MAQEKLTVGGRIRFLRTRKGWTQGQLGEELAAMGLETGVSRSSIASWEQPGTDKFPQIEHVVAMAKLFDTTTDYITGMVDDWQSPRKTDLTFIVTARDTIEHDMLSEWVSLLRSVPMEQQSRLLAITRPLALQFTPRSANAKREADAIFSALYAAGGAEAVRAGTAMLKDVSPDLATAIEYRLRRGGQADEEEEAPE